MSRKKKKSRPEPETLELPLGGVDSHAHLDMRESGMDQDGHELPDDLDEILGAARRAGVSCVGNVFLGPEAYERGKALFADRPEVFFILGIHPTSALDYTFARLERMREQFRQDVRLRAVGEIGLDFYWDDAPPEAQETALRAQLGLARDLELPVVIHSRDAEDQTLRILDEEDFSGRPLLWHCFGRGPEFAEAVLSRGWHLSIPGPVTYRKNEALQRAVAMIPMDRLLVETDSPYLAPEPWRGKRNHPALCAFTAAKIAEIKGLDPATVWVQAGKNACRFFGLPDPCSQAAS
ncbi:TatD family hydrolase [Paucidesulfovibrio gracilis]|nr:TatD family hydrolase [Paucidesulfovibrio gracilis]